MNEAERANVKHIAKWDTTLWDNLYNWDGDITIKGDFTKIRNGEHKMTEFTKEFIDEARKSITEPGIERYICIPVQLEMLDEIERLQDKIAELESELVTTRQKLTDCEAKIAERDKALNDMVHELSRMEIARDELLKEMQWRLENKNNRIAYLKRRLELAEKEREK